MNSCQIILLVGLVVAVIFMCYSNSQENYTLLRRPLDFTGNKQTGCCPPLFNDKPGQVFCRKDIDKYFDIRTIKSYNSYHDMLDLLMQKISTGEFTRDKKLTRVNTCDISRDEIITFINTKIYEAIINNPEFHSNGSFKFESMSVLEIEPEYFVDEDKTPYIKVLFVIHDTTRAASTQAFAVISADKDELTMEHAALVFGDIKEDTTSQKSQNPLKFDIIDSLEYMGPVGDEISTDMEKIIDTNYKC